MAEDGAIREIAEVNNGNAAVVYDMEGRLVVPGFIDRNTHGAQGAM